MCDSYFGTVKLVCCAGAGGLRGVAYRGLLSTLGYLDRVPPSDASALLDVFDDVDSRVDWELVAQLAQAP